MKDADVLDQVYFLQRFELMLLLLQLGLKLRELYYFLLHILLSSHWLIIVSVPGAQISLLVYYYHI